MWLLTPENAPDWLREAGLPAAGPPRIEPLSGGVSGVVLRVESPAGRLVLKQACPRLRTAEAWFSDPGRVAREAEVMDLLSPLFPPGTVPRVLALDRERNVLAMEHAPDGAVPWKGQLLAGEVDPQRAAQAGRMLATIHEATWRRRRKLRHLEDRSVFVQLRVEPFYRSIQRRHPDLADRIEPLVGELLTRREALCHGDFSPKNLLAHPGGLTLVDHETGHLGEPAMDVGFFFSHLFLKALCFPDRYAEWKTFLYAAAIEGYDSPRRQETMCRGMGHLGVCLLARVDGTSPVNYLPDEATREAARALGRRILLDGVQNLNAALDRLAGATTSLRRKDGAHG